MLAVSASRFARAQCGRSEFETAADADAASEDLPRDRRLIGFQSVQDLELEAIEPQPVGKLVV